MYPQIVRRIRQTAVRLPSGIDVIKTSDQIFRPTVDVDCSLLGKVRASGRCEEFVDLEDES